MQNDVVAVTVKGVVPTPNGCAVFLGNDDKIFVIYVDHFVGNAIQMTLDGVKKDRPLTHDLIGSILVGLGTRLERVVINDAHDLTFFARVLLTMENELGTKIVEIDARPSDSIVLSLQHKRPIYVARAVFDSVDDRTDILEQWRKQQEEPGAEPP
ncbi:MAG: bifunctional nuclease family protein [Opitutaceae bacterium]